MRVVWGVQDLKLSYVVILYNNKDLDRGHSGFYQCPRFCFTVSTGLQIAPQYPRALVKTGSPLTRTPVLFLTYCNVDKTVCLLMRPFGLFMALVFIDLCMLHK